MGSCCSKNIEPEVNETTSLLAPPTITQPPTSNQLLDNKLYFQEILAKENETLNEIVMRTSDNLIDISRAKILTENLNKSNGDQQASEYREQLQKSEKLNLGKESPVNKRLSQLYTLPDNQDKDVDLILNKFQAATSPNTSQHLNFLSSFADQFKLKFKGVKVEANQDFVVPLSL